MTTNVTTKFKTVATICWSPIATNKPNHAAHGGVQHLEVRRQRDGSLRGRRTNVNGRHVEVGRSWVLSAEELERWLALAACER